MKKSNIIYAMAGALAFTFFSCYREFDPESYAPEVSIGGFTSSQDIASSNLVAYWPFDGDYTEQVSGDRGENQGTSFGNGIKGQALDGAEDAYMLFEPTQAILNLNSFTLSFWVNSPSTTEAGGIIGLVSLSNTEAFWGNMEVFFENDATNTNGKFRAHIQNDSLDTWVSKDGILNLFDTWNHLTLTYDAASSTFSLYVNGSLSSTSKVADFGSISWQNPGKMVFGTVQFQTTPSLTSSSEAQPWASFLTGLLDEVRIYNVALQPNEIDALVKLEARGN